MRILGIDPGSLHTGYGVVDRQGSKLQTVAHGRISCSRGQPLAERLCRLSRQLDQLLTQHQPDAVVLEALFHGVNPRSLIVLAQARGALLVTLALAGLEVTEYSPAEIKMAVTGNGRADKGQVEQMVKLVLGLGTSQLAPDASDALAAAICFAQRFRVDRLQRRVGRPSTQP